LKDGLSFALSGKIKLLPDLKTAHPIKLVKHNPTFLKTILSGSRIYKRFHIY